MPYICTIKNQEDIKYAEDALYVLSGKWRMAIIVAIYNGHHRYREIASNIPGITFKMLSKELKILDENKLIARIENPYNEKDVSYQITEYCESLYPLVEGMILWAKQHRQIIQ